MCSSSLHQPLYYPTRSHTEKSVQRHFAVSNSYNSWFSFLDTLQGRAPVCSKHIPETETHTSLGRKWLADCASVSDCAMQSPRGGTWRLISSFCQSSLLASSTITNLSMKRSWIYKSWDWGVSLFVYKADYLILFQYGMLLLSFDWLRGIGKTAFRSFSFYCTDFLDSCLFRDNI